MRSAVLFSLTALLLCAQGPQNPPPPGNSASPSSPQPRIQRMPSRAVLPGQPGQPMPPAPAGQPGPMQPMAAPPPTQPQPPDYRALREYLDLSDAQIRRMELARQRAQREAAEKEKALRPQLEDKRLALDDMLEGTNPDAAAVGRAMIEIRNLQRQIRQAHENARTAELAILTPEQKDKFKAIQDAANLPEATRQAQRMGLVPGPMALQPPQAPRPPQPIQ